jgi:hypothetical protein
MNVRERAVQDHPPRPVRVVKAVDTAVGVAIQSLRVVDTLLGYLCLWAGLDAMERVDKR